MNYKFYTADVFTDKIFGGNQLAVFPKAEGLTDEQMQKIAKEFNFSETVFVFSDGEKISSRRLRIFTPSAEIPFAGHPTIGTAYILAAIDDLSLTEETTQIIFQEGIGEIPVKIITQAGKPIYTELTAGKLPEFGAPPPGKDLLASMLSLELNDFLGEPYLPEAVSCGLAYLFIPLNNRDALARAKLNRELWQKILSNYWAPHVYLFTWETRAKNADLSARMFAPGLGIEEDPATGSAATALAGYLTKRQELIQGTLSWMIEQGVEMGRPSLIRLEVDIKNSQPTAIRVGGASVLVSEGTMFV